MQEHNVDQLVQEAFTNASEQTVLQQMFPTLRWLYCLHSPSIFWNSFQETEITTISQMMQVAMSSNSFAIAKSATTKLKMKMKMLLAGFPVALCEYRHPVFRST